jgi:uncharacterized protein (DUF1697 family)
MTTMVALLRGINVSGHNKLPMADLRAVVDECGYGPSRTYIQSGNVVLASDTDDPEAVGAQLRAAIADTTGIDTPVIVRTADELVEIVEQNPYLERGEDPSHVHVSFYDRDAEPQPGDLDRFAPEDATADGPNLYLFLPGGVGRSKLAAHLTKKSEPRGTLRNWRTVTKLLEMTGEP